MSHAARIFTRRHHRKRHLVGILLLAILIAWMVLWSLAALYVDRQIDRILVLAKQAGIEVTYESRFINGNPFSVHAHLEPLSIKLKNGNEINAKESVFYVNLWQHKSFSGKLRDGVNAHLMGYDLTAGIVRFGVAPTSDELRVWLNPLGVTFAEESSFALGNQMDEANIRFNILGPVPNFTKTDSLQSWRDVGGMIDFDEFELKWGPLYVAARGNLALDEKLQPQGAFAGRVKGLDETIGILATRNKIDNKQLSLLRATMDVLAHPTSMMGSSSSMVLPVTLHSNQLYFGPVKLIELPQIEW